MGLMPRKCIADLLSALLKLQPRETVFRQTGQRESPLCDLRWNVSIWHLQRRAPYVFHIEADSDVFHNHLSSGLAPGKGMTCGLVFAHPGINSDTSRPRPAEFQYPAPRVFPSPSKSSAHLADRSSTGGGWVPVIFILILFSNFVSISC